MHKALFLKRYEQLGHAFNPETTTPRPAIRINTLKTTPQQLTTRLKRKGARLTRIPWLKHGYWYSAPFSLGATPEYLQGYYYLQGAASQLAAEILNPAPNTSVIDMAAAPGSKSTHLAQIMQNTGVLTCLDIKTKRLTTLRNNLERCGVTNAITYRKDARFATDLGKTYHSILLDAPCSGNWAADKTWPENKTIDTFKHLAKTQRELLKAAWHCLKPGGTLLYSTCSLEPEENELVINWFLNKYPTATLEPINTPIGDHGLTTIFGHTLNPLLARTKRLWPDKTGTEGFFYAKIKKPTKP